MARPLAASNTDSFCGLKSRPTISPISIAISAGRRALSVAFSLFDGHDLRRTQILRAVHLAAELRCVAKEDMLGADAKDQLALGAILARCRNCNPRAGSEYCGSS